MPNEHVPEDPDRVVRGVEYRSSRLHPDAPLDRDYDPNPPSSGKVTLFAIGIAVVLGAIFYALNTTSLTNALNPPPTQSAQSGPTSPQAPSGTHPVTPHAPNSTPGMTTGTAPAQQPAIPQATAPENMSRNPPAAKQ